MSILYKSNFNLVPISVDLIEKQLYLGNLAAAKDVNTIKKYKISHILTVDDRALPQEISEIKGLVTKTQHIKLSDNAKQDILSKLQETYEFISNAIANNGVVLVHCYFGASRSASIVIAFLMKKYNQTYGEAFKKVKARRSIVYPNLGFVWQLELYCEMNYAIDAENSNYKSYNLARAAEKVQKLKHLPKEFRFVVKEVNSCHGTNNYFKCLSCGEILADESNLFSQERDGFFIEPLSWMNVEKSVEGALSCPKCSGVVGAFNWIEGGRFNCGVYRVKPSFVLSVSTVLK